MQVTVENLGNLKRKLLVEVPLAEVQSTYEAVYADIKGKLRVNGFRPGKFPRALAEKRFQDVMMQEAAQTLVPKYMQQALEQEKLEPATRPQYDKLNIDKNKPLTFEAIFEVAPSFDLPKTSSFKLTAKTVKVAAKDVDERIETLRQDRGQMKEKAADAVAEKGDQAIIDFEGFKDGTPFNGGQGNDMPVDLGAGRFLEDFEKALYGMKAGEDKTFPMTFPQDYGEKTLAGQDVEFKITLKRLEQKEPADLEPAFFGQFDPEIKTEKDFKDHIKKQITDEKEREVQNEQRTELTEQVKKALSFDVPEEMVEFNLHEFEHRLSHDDPDTYNDEKKREAAKEERRTQVLEELRMGFFVTEVAKQKDLKAEENDVYQRFYMQAYMMQQNPQELIKSEFGERLLYDIRHQMLTELVLNKLVEEVLGDAKPAKATKAAKADDAAEGEEAPKKAAPKKKAAKPKEESAEEK